MLQATATNKACRVCGGSFLPFTSTQIVCSVSCAKKIPVIARNTVKAEKRMDRIKKDSLKPRSHWLKEAQREFNAYIRARDQELVCISCGRNHGGQWHAGHYLSTGANPGLRFDESNVHKQCQPCNTHLHGNIAMYRIALLAKVGADEVARLEGPHEPKHYTTEALKDMAREYRAKAKQLSKENT